MGMKAADTERMVSSRTFRRCCVHGGVLPIRQRARPSRKRTARGGSNHLPRAAGGSCWRRQLAEVAIDAEEVLQDLDGDGRDLDGFAVVLLVVAAVGLQAGDDLGRHGDADLDGRFVGSAAVQLHVGLLVCSSLMDQEAG